MRIVYPSFADDAAGLLRTAMRSEGITVFLEPKALYNAKQAMTPIPDDFEVPFGVARIRRPGKHLSIITYGNTVHFCIEAANELSKEGIEVEVIDLRSLNPLDEGTIEASIKKTARALVVHEDKVFGGFGGEVASIISEKFFKHLDAPVMRLGSTYTPVGFNRILEKSILVDKNKILLKIREILKY